MWPGVWALFVRSSSRSCEQASVGDSAALAGLLRAHMTAGPRHRRQSVNELPGRPIPAWADTPSCNLNGPCGGCSVWSYTCIKSFVLVVPVLPHAQPPPSIFSFIGNEDPFVLWSRDTGARPRNEAVICRGPDYDTNPLQSLRASTHKRTQLHTSCPNHYTQNEMDSAKWKTFIIRDTWRLTWSITFSFAFYSEMLSTSCQFVELIFL